MVTSIRGADPREHGPAPRRLRRRLEPLSDGQACPPKNDTILYYIL